MSLIDPYRNETVTITPRATAHDTYGRPSYTGETAVTTTARVIEKQQKVYSPDGAVIVYDKIFLLAPTETVDEGYKITHDGVDHQVIEIQKGKDLDGNLNHYKVLVRVGIR